MKKIELPIMSISTNLNTALGTLNKENRGALLAEDNGQYQLYSAGNIVCSRDEGKHTLSELSPENTLALGSKSRQGGSLDIVLEKVTAFYASVEIHQDALADRFISSPKDYYCNGLRHHDDFPPPYVSEGDACPRGCGGTIVSK